MGSRLGQRGIIDYADGRSMVVSVSWSHLVAHLVATEARENWKAFRLHETAKVLLTRQMHC